MALGSSAPEIMLAVIEQALLLGKEQGDSLGVFTIIGSAAFNLFIITSICIISVPSPDVKFIKEFGVFLTTTFYSIFAYVWMLIVVQYISPGVIEPWEAWVTVGYMPVFVLHSYAQDSGWWFYKCKSKSSVSDESPPRIRNEDKPVSFLCIKLVLKHQRMYHIKYLSKPCLKGPNTVFSFL
jgi:solute carrier family 8 (sodium/calcium exchanger)